MDRHRGIGFAQVWGDFWGFCPSFLPKVFLGQIFE
jgi:hypothetical protein